MVTIRSGLSPAVRVQEIDISDYVVNQINTIAMLIGVSQAGPAFKIRIVQSERDFVEEYGLPTPDTVQTFYAASGFFVRGNNLLFTRVVDRPTARVSAIGFDFNSSGKFYDPAYPIPRTDAQGNLVFDEDGNQLFDFGARWVTNNATDIGISEGSDAPPYAIQHVEVDRYGQPIIDPETGRYITYAIYEADGSPLVPLPNVSNLDPEIYDNDRSNYFEANIFPYYLRMSDPESSLAGYLASFQAAGQTPIFPAFDVYGQPIEYPEGHPGAGAPIPEGYDWDNEPLLYPELNDRGETIQYPESHPGAGTPIIIGPNRPGSFYNPGATSTRYRPGEYILDQQGNRIVVGKPYDYDKGVIYWNPDAPIDQRISDFPKPGYVAVQLYLSPFFVLSDVWRTAISQYEVEKFYNSRYDSTQAFYARHQMNKPDPRVRNAVYEVGDLVTDGFLDNHWQGQSHRTSGDEWGNVYKCIQGGLTGWEYNNIAQMQEMEILTGKVVLWGGPTFNTAQKVFNDNYGGDLANFFNILQAELDSGIVNGPARQLYNNLWTKESAGFIGAESPEGSVIPDDATADWAIAALEKYTETGILSDKLTNDPTMSVYDKSDRNYPKPNVGDIIVDGEVIWKCIASEMTNAPLIEKTVVGGIRYKHGPVAFPEYYDPDNTETFSHNVTINGEDKIEDMTIAAIGPGEIYNDLYIFILGYEDAMKLRQYSYSINVPRETWKSDSYVPAEFVDWGDDASGSNPIRVMSKVTYQQAIARFNFLQQIPENLPRTPYEFGLMVLSRDTVSNSWSQREYFRCSTDLNAIDGNGQKMFVEEVVNNKSKLIRVNLADTALKTKPTSHFPVPLAGGYVGDLRNFYETKQRDPDDDWFVSLSGELFHAADMYRESDIDVDVVIEGDAPIEVKRQLAMLAEDLNGEAIAVLDVPYAHSDVNSIVAWAANSLMLGGETGSYAALYHNRLKIYDKYNGVYRWIAPSGTVAGIYARVDEVFFPWYAPAGSRRGTLPEVLELRENFRLPQRDILYANRVNPIAVIRNAITIYGQKTLLDRDSYLNRVNVRRLLCFLKRRCRRLLEQYVFEFNDEITREEISGIFNNFLDWVQAHRGLEEYLVVCNETNNGQFVRENNQLYCDIYVKPTPVAEFIYLRFFVTRASVNLQELASRFSV